MTGTQVLYADAVLFDMDGTLTDSIAAVEAAWGKVATDIGQDPKYVIAATHGKRAIDNLAHFKPDIKAAEMEKEVENFENTILYFADAYNLHGPGSQPGSRSTSGATTPFYLSSGAATPSLSPGSSAPSSRANSFSLSRRPSFASSFANRLSNMLRMNRVPENEARISYDDGDDGEDRIEAYQVVDGKVDGKTEKDIMEAWKLEAANVDRSVQILPGVRKLMDSIPRGRYAVATSGARTYAFGCMTRVGIEPPSVTVTADDPRLKRGKPHPDPFLLAAKDLGYEASNCIVFEDSPSGIRAGVASGATVVAVCTSHERSQIENCGAHYIVENMEQINCTMEGARLQFTIVG